MTRNSAQGLMRIRQRLCGRMPKFALIGAFGAGVNVAIMTVLVAWGVNYLIAALIATETTIVSNFLMQERFVFAGLGPLGRSKAIRFLHSFGFNNAETLARVPFLWLLVDKMGVVSPLAQLGTLSAAFIVRYTFHSRVVYAPTPAATDCTPSDTTAPREVAR
ncbi:GtrA family protein [Arthrobacter sp. MMS18-M83]|uniref:GtrA family protein n=1 Tax=Arthrobacter sp. MMS18-M83 TaxID=2996261 RepID=UPI00227AD0BD|nr:GtrA family protein [Arthrobacter sp. MMS18-M83]WAH97251.1 GtrA family protein [Arthrobacter sp. MMS18-M83]